MNTTVLTKVMFGDFRAELVERKRFFTGQQLEVFRCYPMMERTLLGADRAVALNDPIKLGLCLKLNPAAMTASLVCLSHVSLPA